jgi:hypothetical protein
MIEVGVLCTDEGTHWLGFKYGTNSFFDFTIMAPGWNNPQER